MYLALRSKYTEALTPLFPKCCLTTNKESIQRRGLRTEHHLHSTEAHQGINAQFSAKNAELFSKKN